MKKTLLLLLSMVLLCFQSLYAQNLNQGLIAKYCFNGDAVDLVGSKNGTLMNGATGTTDRFSNEGGAIRLDGVDDFIQLPSAGWIEGDFTFSGWVNLKSNGFWPHLWGFGNGTNVENIFVSLDQGGNNLLHFTTHNCSNGANYNRVTVPTAFPLNVWTHIAVTLSGSTVNIYKDNILWQTGTTPNLPCVGAKDSAFIGKSNFTFNNNDLVHADLDDFRFYDRALTVTEIGMLYTLGQDYCAAQGVNNLQVAPLQFSPNPASSSITVNGINSNQINAVTLTSVSGQKMNCAFQDTRIFNLPKTPGIYFIEVSLKSNQVLRNKLVIE